MKFDYKSLFTRPQTKHTPHAVYSVREEIANGITHGIGVAFSISGLTLLIVFAVLYGGTEHIIAFSIYGTSMFLLYLASTLYHSLQDPSAKKLFQILDHAAIYLLIAGTYTPFIALGLRTTFGWILLGIVWAIAIAGIFFKLFFINRFQVASTIAYVAMGWLAVFSWREILTNVPTYATIWLVAGGITYTAGVIFYALDGVKYSHAVWHLFVLGGTVCHFVSMLYLIPWA